MRLFLLLSLVGNFTFAYSHKNWIVLTAEDEESIVRQAEELAPKIINAEIIDVISFGRRHDCTFRVRKENTPRRLKVTSLNINKYYEYNEGEFRPYFKASLYYRFMDCRKKKTKRY